MTGARWVRPVALTLVASLVCVLLGFWQLERRATRLATIAVVEAGFDADPQSFSRVLGPPGSTFDDVDEYTPVRVRGVYDEQGTLLVRNRPLEGTYGYYVLVPLELRGDDAGTTLLVNRGWIPSGASGRAPDSVPRPPGEEVEATVRLRAPEPGDGRQAPEGQVQRVDLAGSVTDALLGEEGVGDGSRLETRAYGQLAAEDPRPSDAPLLLPEPDTDPGPHLGYSVQWFVFAGGMWVLLVVHVRRTLRDERDGDAGPAAGHPRVPHGQRSRRRADEEAEDALLDAAEQR